MNHKLPLVLIFTVVLFISGCTEKPSENKECVLSLCDCRCHTPNDLPEKDGRLCGINCLQEKGVIGCEHRDGSCSEVYAPPKNCSVDSDCAVDSSRCADGVDPYHVCEEGKCVTLTFIQNPCIASHVCPKGNWHRVSDGSCFRYDNCREKGCDDGSDDTVDVCVNQGTRSEGCMYTIKDPYTCESDSDCVPQECCHPTSCINAKYKKSCEGVACTMVCEGPIDCGAGRCECYNNKCTVKKIKKDV